MEKIALAGKRRNESGKNSSRRLRAAGRIPAVVYGGATHLSLSVDRHAFESSFKQVSVNTLIDLTIEGEGTREVLIREYQRDKVRGMLIHLDFYEVMKGHKLRTRVPLHFEGTPVGVRVDKGLLETHLYAIEIECEPKDIPANIVVDISEIALNQALHVRDLHLPEGVVSLESGDAVVALVSSVHDDEGAGEGAAETDASAVPAASAQKTEARAQEKTSKK
ncbi:MAG: 50S ribosomal protein L25 [Spirochaetota bacterium]|jgi:large subunit ribosomal protein L25|nr:50S ribosomal protein L25 [Spirochaetota bacterium]